MSVSKQESKADGGTIPKWMFAVLGLFMAAYAATVVATGEPIYLVPVLILVGLVLGYAMVNRRLTRRVIERDGSLENAMNDDADPIPSAHLIPDSETPLGDTPEAHDEISPHDLPIGHPSREAAEEQVDEPAGTTRGNADPAEAGEGAR